MPFKLKTGILFLASIFFCSALRSQHLAFSHLGVDEGMPSNLTSYACFDSSGLIWIGSYDGVIGYDGNRLHQYLKETHPGLPLNIIDYLYCDSKNRVWITTGEGLAQLDEHRHLKRIVISDTITDKNIDECVEIPGLGFVVFGSRKTYLLPDGKEKWEPFQWFDQTIRKGNGVFRVRKFKGSTIMFICRGNVMLADLLEKKIITQTPVPGAVHISRLNDSTVIVSNGDKFELYTVNVHTSKIVRSWRDVVDINGKPIKSAIVSSDIAANGIVYITTRSNGLVSLNPATDQFRSYLHDPLDKTSISADNLRRVLCQRNGNIIITSTTGLSYTNVLVPIFQQKNKFVDDHGKVMDNLVMAAEDANSNLWLGSSTTLLIWDPKTDKAKNITPPLDMLQPENESAQAAGICRDHLNNMWVSYNGMGLARYNAEGKLLHFFTKEKAEIPTNRIRLIHQLSNNKLIVGAEDGLFLIDPVNLKTDTLGDHPALKKIRRKRVVNIMVDGEKVWIACSPRGGAYCYDFTAKTLRTIKGLSTDRVYCFGKDNRNNIYIGTYEGLNVLSPDGRIHLIDQSNGLLHLRVENINKDSLGRLWITNFNTLICYNPLDSTFTYFDEQNGVSNSGFTIAQSVNTKDGKILFCNNGLLTVDSRIQVNPNTAIPHVVINRMYEDGGFDLLPETTSIELPYNKAKISFYYLVHNLYAAKRFLFRYKMDGLDKGWQQPTKNTEVTYNLRPGKYTFYIQTSYNEGSWNDTANKITIIVNPPWWQTLWFRGLVILSLAGILYFLYRRRIRAIKYKASIKQQMTELEGKALRSQMNPHFIFNSLNAIQELIVTKNFDESYQYLSNFSKLLRQVLNNSERNTIPLSAEIEMIRLQLSLESLRFKRSFSYHIEVEKNIEPDLVNIPPLLLQPYVENAVWHGLRNKEGEKNLWIRVSEVNGKLDIEIEDDGVGRQKAEEIKLQKLGAKQFESKGSLLSQQRIKILNETYPGGATVNIIDLKNEQQEASGTKVKISLPTTIS